MIRRRRPRRLERQTPEDRERLRAVHLLRCCVSRVPYAGPCRLPIQASHVRQMTGLGLKPPDSDTLPMCAGHHEDWEQRKGVFRGWSDGQRWTWAAAALERVAVDLAAMEAAPW